MSGYVNRESSPLRKENQHEWVRKWRSYPLGKENQNEWVRKWRIIPTQERKSTRVGTRMENHPHSGKIINTSGYENRESSPIGKENQHEWERKWRIIPTQERKSTRVGTRKEYHPHSTKKVNTSRYVNRESSPLRKENQHEWVRKWRIIPTQERKSTRVGTKMENHTHSGKKINTSRYEMVSSPLGKENQHE
ncbi:hypothetical protein ACLM5H_11085 [Fredinandcohnia humi]